MSANIKYISAMDVNNNNEPRQIMLLSYTSNEDITYEGAITDKELEPFKTYNIRNVFEILQWMLEEYEFKAFIWSDKRCDIKITIEVTTTFSFTQTFKLKRV